MLEHLGSVASTASVLVGLVAVTGFGYQRGRVANLREQLDDERKETASLKEQRAERDQQINDLKAVVRIATGEVQTQAILDLLEHHHASAERRGERNDDLLEQILDILVRRKS